MDVTLFSYRRGDTAMHRMNAAFKVIFLVVFCLLVFWEPCEIPEGRTVSLGAVIVISSCFCVSWICFFLAGANWKSLAALRFVFVIGGLLTLLKMTDSVKDGFLYGLVYTARFFTSAFMAQTVFETTSIMQIQDALHLPVLISLSINFIPQIFYEWKKITLASRARRTPTRNPVKNIGAYLFELEALLLTMLDKAENVRKALDNRSRS